MSKPDELTSLYGVGKKRAGLLRHLGIRGFEDLISCDLQEVGWELSRYDSHVTMATLEGLRSHARSYLTGRPLLFGPFPRIGSSYLIFDLEYDSFKIIWLVGLLLVEGETVRHRHLWADDAEAERRNLEELARVLRGRGNLPLLTWAGQSADLPQLRHATDRLGLKGVFEGAFDDHTDLFARCEDSLRLPVPGLGLDAVSTFFGYRKESSIANGLEALRLYGTYRNLDDADAKAQLRSDLVTYNRDDLRALVATERALDRLVAGEGQAGSTSDVKTVQAEVHEAELEVH